MSNFKNNSNFITKNYNHIFALILLSIYYFLSFILFKEIVLNPHDNLDISAVYDHVIGRFYNGNLEASNNFLSGTIKWYYIENILYPTNLLHLILEDKQFYFTDEILKKILPYCSFYILAKSISKNKFNNTLSAIVYSSIINIGKLFGYGMVMMPYFLYLLIRKQKLKPKHFFIIIFTGLNSSLVQDYLALLLLIPLSILLKQSFRNININIMVAYFISISISILLASFPIILSLIETQETHRVNSNINGIHLILTNTLNYFLTLPGVRGIAYLFPIPLFFLYFFILFFSITSGQRNLILITFFLILLFIISLFINLFLKNIIFSNFLIFLQGFNFQRIDRVIPLTMSILLAYNLKLFNKSYLKKFIYFLSIFTVITIHASVPIKEAGKQFFKTNIKQKKYDELKNNIKNNVSLIKITKFLIDKNNYQKNKLSFNLNSLNTFDSYYKFEVYSFIKSIVKKDRVMSVGIDPMIAVMNDIKVIDGYHTIYPMEYKKKFRKIIAAELEANDTLKDYYDNWGNRVYVFFNDKNNLLLNFIEAKNIGATYVISAFSIKSINLELICSNCFGSKEIFLYKIL